MERLRWTLVSPHDDLDPARYAGEFRDLPEAGRPGDWCRVVVHDEVGDMRWPLIAVDSARNFFLADKNCPLDYEPSGEDFLSPCLGEADVMRRVLSQEEFASWLKEFLPQIPATPAQSDALIALGRAVGLAVTAIGTIVAGHERPRFLDGQGQELVLKRLSYSHF